MGMLERRIAALEAKAADKDRKTRVLLVDFIRFADQQGINPELTVATCSGHEWRRADGETEDAFKARVEREADRLQRKPNQPVAVVLLKRNAAPQQPAYERH